MRVRVPLKYPSASNVYVMDIYPWPPNVCALYFHWQFWLLFGNPFFLSVHRVLGCTSCPNPEVLWNLPQLVGTGHSLDSSRRFGVGRDFTSVTRKADSPFILQSSCSMEYDNKIIFFSPESSCLETAVRWGFLAMWSGKSSSVFVVFCSLH